jgi:hypothetical protein
MSVTNRALIQAQYAPNAAATLYTAPSSTKTIIDKFTATNNDASARTVSVYLVPFGETRGADHLITSALSIPAGDSLDLPELKNHVLEPGDMIDVVASVASQVVVRASGREIV